MSNIVFSKEYIYHQTMGDLQWTKCQWGRVFLQVLVELHCQYNYTNILY